MNAKNKIITGSRRVRLGDNAYRLIKEDVVLCRLRPGTEVTEAALAKHYQLGLAPIRSALSRLCQERLIKVLPRRGYLITPITLQDVKNVFDLRLLLEPAAARAAAGNVSESTLKELDSAPLGRSKRSKYLEFLKDNRNFHVMIAYASGNERMARILESLHDDMERLIHLGLFSDRDPNELRLDHEMQRKQHRALIDALVAGDADAAQEAATRHVEHSRELVMNAVMNRVFEVAL